MTVSSGSMWIGVISINIYHTYLLIVISPAVDFLLYSTLFSINSFVFLTATLAETIQSTGTTFGIFVLVIVSRLTAGWTILVSLRKFYTHIALDLLEVR